MCMWIIFPGAGAEKIGDTNNYCRKNRYGHNAFNHGTTATNLVDRTDTISGSEKQGERVGKTARALFLALVVCAIPFLPSCFDVAFSFFGFKSSLNGRFADFSRYAGFFLFKRIKYKLVNFFYYFFLVGKLCAM